MSRYRENPDEPLADGSRESPQYDAHVLLFLDHDENRRLLADWLSQSYTVTAIETVESLAQPFDLCVVDEQTLSKCVDALQERKATDTVDFLPVLLLSPRPLSDLDPAIWQHIDEVISTPIKQAELKIRLDGLLDRRRQFVALQQRQQMIEALHDATREMIQTTDPEEICEIAVDAAEQVLGLPLTAAWLEDESGERLVPVAQTDESSAFFDGLPTYTAAENSLSWQAFASGETKVFGDLTSTVTPDELQNPETEIQSELIVPLGDCGVMNIGSTSPREFVDDDIYGAQLLATNTGTALERAAREKHLAEQNSRMEFFHSILRHDVLNGMTVIQSRADALAEQLDDEQKQYARTIDRWSCDIVDVVNRVRSVLQTLTGDAPIELVPVDLAEVLETEVDRLRKTYPAVTFETEVPEQTTAFADELLSEVLGNVLINAVEHNDPTDLTVRVTVETDEEWATIRIADTGTGIPDEDKEAIFRRGKTGHAKTTGSGFGLFFVDTMIDNYGGDIWVEDRDRPGGERSRSDGTDRQGAVFVIKLPATE